MRILNYVAIIFALSLVSCGGSDMEKLKWLEGTWVRQYNETTQIEEWTWAKKIINGKGYYVTDGDTTLMERMSITENNGTLIYTADVPENEIKVQFSLKDIGEKMVSFEKKNYDWPQLIIYANMGDSLKTTATGEVNEQTKSAEFTFNKVK